MSIKSVRASTLPNKFIKLVSARRYPTPPILGEALAVVVISIFCSPPVLRSKVPLLMNELVKQASGSNPHEKPLDAGDVVPIELPLTDIESLSPLAPASVTCKIAPVGEALKVKVSKAGCPTRGNVNLVHSPGLSVIVAACEAPVGDNRADIVTIAAVDTLAYLTCLFVEQVPA